MSNKPSELTPHVFENGRQVLVRRLSPLLSYQLRKDFPPPKPPMQEVTLSGGTKELEPNPASPLYLEAMREYEENFNTKIQNLMLKRGVIVELTDEDKAEVKELREFWQEEFGKSLNESDKMVYITMIAITSQSDLENLLKKIVTKSEPTEESIAAAEDSFQG